MRFGLCVGRQVVSRLRRELGEELGGRMEGLDGERETVEYCRQRGELLALYAKGLLATGEAGAGYRYGLVGAYGDAELGGAGGGGGGQLLPLLRRLIEMLEGGRGFTGARGGTDVTITQGALVVQAASSAAVTAAAAPAEAERQTVTAQQPGGHAHAAVQQTDAVQSSMTRVIGGGGDAASSRLTGDDRDRELATRFAYEAAKLESDLKANESRSVERVLDGAAAKKAGLAADLASDLAGRLAGVTDDARRHALMAEYADNLQRLTDALERQKQKQLDELRASLAARRRTGGKELNERQAAQAAAAGAAPGLVPSAAARPQADLEREMRTTELEHAQRQLRGAEQGRGGVRATTADELRGRVRQLGLEPAQEEALLKVNRPPRGWILWCKDDLFSSFWAATL